MRISTKGRYSLRAMIDVSLFSSEQPVRLKDMSERINISRNYLVKLFQSLRKAGLVNSVQGRSGGFVLNKPASEISVRDILVAADESIIPITCFGCDADGTDDCGLISECVASSFWNEFKRYAENFFRNTTLQELHDQAKAKETSVRR